MHIKHFNNEEAFIQTSSELILKTLVKNEFKVALSGGCTPQPVYKRLAEDISKYKTAGKNFIGDFYQVDERYVPNTHENSNQKMILETGIPLNMCFKTSLSLPKCIEEYDKKLPQSTFNLCVLGIGPDGHTASIFPKSSAISSSQKVVHSNTNEFPVRDRLTLTFKTIMESDSLLVLVKNKRSVLSQLKNPRKEIEEFPALKLLQHKKLIIHSLEN